ncbi:hypothetical protein Tco_0661292 [Tanacetum coccineum]
MVRKVLPNQLRVVDILFIENAPHYVCPGFSESVIACGLPRETLVDNCYQSSLWLTHVIHILAGVLMKWIFVAKVNEEGEGIIIILYLSEFFTFNSWTDIQNISKDFYIDSALLVGQKKFIRICALDLLNYVLKLLHKDFGDICKDSESLEARGIHDYIHDNLKCLFLLWHSAFRS